MGDALHHVMWSSSVARVPVVLLVCFACAATPAFAQTLKSELEIELDKIIVELTNEKAALDNAVTRTAQKAQEVAKAKGQAVEPINPRNPNSPSWLEQSIKAQAMAEAKKKARDHVIWLKDNLTARHDAFAPAPELATNESLLPKTFEGRYDALLKQGGLLGGRRNAAQTALRSFEPVYKSTLETNGFLAPDAQGQMFQLTALYGQAEAELRLRREVLGVYARLKKFYPSGGRITAGSSPPAPATDTTAAAEILKK